MTLRTCCLAAGPRWAPRGRGWAGADWVGPSGSAQVGRIGFVFFQFSETISSAKTITVNSSKCLQDTKNTQKITKIPGKFLEVD
jgi:hypothetical protein